MVTERDLTGHRGATRTVLVFDSKSGRIVHVHDTIAIPGAELPEDSELAAQARSKVGAFEELTAGAVDTLLITEPLRPGASYRVDPQTRAIVEVTDSSAE
jgi:hypothetical protein